MLAERSIYEHVIALAPEMMIGVAALLFYGMKIGTQRR